MPEATTTNSGTSPNPVSSNYAGELDPKGDFVDYVKEYAKEKPEVAALWCVGIGFILGWKLKPW